LKWDPPLEEAIILKRYKRFLADVQLGTKILTVHVPNTGSMSSCWGPDWKCALSLSPNPDRKLPYTLELTHNGDSWIGVNTANANKIVLHWLKEKKIPELQDYETIITEKKIGESRIDFCLESPGHQSCFVEVKSVTLKMEEVAQFPDAVSERGQKHLRELIKLKNNGHRAVLFFLVQREDVKSMKPARSIDPKYASLIQEAVSMGVEILVYQCKIDQDQISLGKALPFSLE
jgi:sugar fermentation stimulation protein A